MTFANKENVRKYGLPFYLVILFLCLEYGRPQNILPQLSVLHLPAVTCIILFLLLWLSGKLTISDKQTKLFISLLLLMGIHTYCATNNYMAFHICKSMLITFIAYLAIITFVDSYHKIKILITSWLVIHVYLGIFGIIHKGRGVGGFLGDENDFSMVLNMIIPFSFFLAFSENNKGTKLIYFMLTGFFLIVEFMTLSRGGFIGLAAACIYCIWRSKRKIVSAFVIAIIALSAIPYAPDTYWSEIKSIAHDGMSAGTGEERVFEWKVAWQMFSDNPLLGVGQGNFPYRFREYEIAYGFPDGLHGRSRAGRAAHSIYFTLLPELGIAGLIIVSLMIFYVFKCTRDIRKLLGASLSFVSHNNYSYVFYLTLAIDGSLIAYLVSGIFISVLYYPSFWFLVGFASSARKAFS